MGGLCGCVAASDARLLPQRHNSSSPGGACVNFDAQASVFRSATLDGEQGLCLSLGPAIRPCDLPSPAAGLPLCNASLSVGHRVRDLVGRIPAAAKPHQLVTSAPAINSLWIPAQKYWNEALHGLLSGGAVSPTNESVWRRPTEFPSALSSAASFNRSLFWEIGSAVGTEARVESNAGTSRGWTFWSPNVNIFRDPVSHVSLSVCGAINLSHVMAWWLLFVAPVGETDSAMYVISRSVWCDQHLLCDDALLFVAQGAEDRKHRER